MNMPVKARNAGDHSGRGPDRFGKPAEPAEMQPDKPIQGLVSEAIGWVKNK